MSQGALWQPRGWDGVVGGREAQEEGHIYTYDLTHDDIWQKPTQHCKAIILQLKVSKFFFKVKNITKQKPFKSPYPGISLVVQWLRRHATYAGNPGSIPGQGTRSHMPQLRPGTSK